MPDGVQHIMAPAFAEAGHLGQLIHQPGRHQQSPSLDDLPIIEGHRKAVGRPLGALGRSQDNARAVRLGLLPPDGDQVSGRDAVTGQEAVHAIGRGVAGSASVDDDDGAASAAQDERGAEAGRAATDDSRLGVSGDDCW
jgi:hypothetical protein